MFVKYFVSLFVVLCVTVLFPSTRGNCNGFICGSIVSKCLITQSCQCKLSDCFCCKDCFNCLGELYTECCACVEMCPTYNDSLSALAPKSQIGDFEGVPELFETLTAEEDEDQWSTIRFPARNSLHHHYNTYHHGFSHKRPSNLINCTVIYLNICTSNKKCSQYCESMGASSYRWFHDGCCECVGANCYNYGINESRCSACPNNEENDEDSEDENMYDEEDDYDGGTDDGPSRDYNDDEINYN